MNDARLDVDFCYLCGGSLPLKRKRLRHLRSAEHVIPRAILGDEPRNRRDAWPVILDVHRECEYSIKMKVDNLIDIMGKMFTLPVEEWPRRGELRRLNMEPALLQIAKNLPSIPVMSNIEPLITGVWTWIRGFHAAMYCRHMSEDVNHTIFPPVPAFNAENEALNMKNAEFLSKIIRDAVQVGIQESCWDGIDAWGGGIKYRAVWYHFGDRLVRDNPCFWTLSVPGTHKWSRGVMKEGYERPWHGVYKLEETPRNAACVGPHGSWISVLHRSKRNKNKSRRRK